MVADDCDVDMAIATSPQSETGVSSPVTVCAPHRALCQRPPGENRHECVLMAEAARIMMRAYRELVRVGFYGLSDIYEKGSDRVLRHAQQDPMGVMFSAVCAMRYLATPDILAQHSLGERVRQLLAVILHISYKLKTEANWEPGSYANITVLSCFLRADEIPQFGWSQDWRARDQHCTDMYNIEAQIVCTQPAFRLFDDNPYQGLESHLEKCLKDKLLSEREARMILGSSFFYYYAAALNTEQFMLEEFGTFCTTEQLGLALAAIGRTAINCVCRGQTGHCCVPDEFATPVITVARKFVSNAATVAKRDAAMRKASVSEGKMDKAYLETDNSELTQLVVLSQVAAALAAHVEREL